MDRPSVEVATAPFLPHGRSVTNALDISAQPAFGVTPGEDGGVTFGEDVVGSGMGGAPPVAGHPSGWNGSGEVE
jgi:hypothetical protein